MSCSPDATARLTLFIIVDSSSAVNFFMRPNFSGYPTNFLPVTCPTYFSTFLSLAACVDCVNPPRANPTLLEAATASGVRICGK